MSDLLLYALAGAVIVCVGLLHVLAQANLLRKVLAANVVSSGAFLIIVAMANRQAELPADPVPHALVLTGIVVAISATGLLLLFVCRYQDATGRLTLEEDEEQ